MKLISLLILTIVAISMPAPGRADIYRLDGDDDVVSFTDTPKDRRYTLIIREKQLQLKKRLSWKPGSSPKMTGTMASHQPDQIRSIARTLPVQGVITSPTGIRNDPFDGKLKHHNGLDIAAPSGTPVKPVAPGTVIFSGWKNGYGNTVILEHDNGMVTVYAHHSSNNVSEGTTVNTDAIIAHSGSTGRSTGPHLHFEAWQNGTNITPDFMPPGTTAGHPPIAAPDTPIRRYLQEDGTLLFTNLR